MEKRSHSPSKANSKSFTTEGVRYKNNKYFVKHLGPSDAEIRFKQKMGQVRKEQKMVYGKAGPRQQSQIADMNEVVNFASPAKEMRQRLVDAQSILDEGNSQIKESLQVDQYASDPAMDLLRHDRKIPKQQSVTNRVFGEEDSGLDKKRIKYPKSSKLKTVVQSTPVNELMEYSKSFLESKARKSRKQREDNPYTSKLEIKKQTIQTDDVDLYQFEPTFFDGSSGQLPPINARDSSFEQRFQDEVYQYRSQKELLQGSRKSVATIPTRQLVHIYNVPAGGGIKVDYDQNGRKVIKTQVAKSLEAQEHEDPRVAHLVNQYKTADKNRKQMNKLLEMIDPAQQPKEFISYTEMKDHSVYSGSTKPATNFVYQGPIMNVDMVSDQLLSRPKQSEAVSIKPLSLKNVNIQKQTISGPKSVVSQPYKYTQSTLVRQLPKANEVQSENWEAQQYSNFPQTEQSVGSYEGPQVNLKSRRGKKLAQQFRDGISDFEQSQKKLKGIKPIKSQANVVRVPNQSYVVSHGQAIPTALYVAESPFVETTIQKPRHNRNISQSVSKSNTSLKKVTTPSEFKPLQRNSSISHLQSRAMSIGVTQQSDEEEDIEDYDYLFSKNQALKEQIQEQVNIFEQYIKVAKIQRDKELNLKNMARKERIISARSLLQKSKNRQLDDDFSDFKSMKSPSIYRGEPDGWAFGKVDKNITDKISISSNVVTYWQDPQMHPNKIRMVKGPSTHTPQIQLLNQIQELWKELEKHRNHEIVYLEDDLRNKSHDVARLHDENNIELELLRTKQKQLLHADYIRKTRDPAIRDQDLHRKEIKELEAKIKKQVERRNELSQWGFNSYVISYRIKVRMMENLIEKAQRYRMSPNADLESEILKMKVVRDKTFDDLAEIMEKKDPRENLPSRNKKKKNLRSYNGQLEAVNEKYEYEWELLKNLKLLLKQINQDQQLMEMINNNSIDTIRREVGDGFFKLNNLRRLRGNQKSMGRVFDPSDQKLKKISNKSPYKQKIKTKDSKIIKKYATEDDSAENELDHLGQENDSKWLQVLMKEGSYKPPKEVVDTPSKKARVDRLWKMFEESEPEEQNSDKELEDRMDALAAHENMDKFMHKLDSHLDAEKALIEDWRIQQQRKDGIFE